MNLIKPRKRNAIVILNGISLKKKIFYNNYLPALSKILDVQVHETLSKNDARSIASKFADRYVDVLIAAGGDGTLNQVVNGMLTGRETEKNLPLVAVIPMGSGNDFARGAGVKPEVEHAIKAFDNFTSTPVDVGIVEYSVLPESVEKGYAYFVNVVDIGMGPEVVNKVLNSGRPFGSAVAYYKSILDTFLTYKPMSVTARTNSWEWSGKLRTLAVANGKYYGHGLCVAPEANINDRLYNIFICGNVSVLDFIRHTGALKKGKAIKRNEVIYKTATEIAFESQGPCPIEADGEILGFLPATVKIMQRQLKFLI